MAWTPPAPEAVDGAAPTGPIPGRSTGPRGTGWGAATLALAVGAVAVGLAVWLGRATPAGPPPDAVELPIAAVSPPVLHGDLVLVPVVDGLVAFDRDAGTEVWRVGGCPFSGWPQHDPATAGGRVLAVCDGDFRVIDVDAAALGWVAPREAIPRAVRLSPDVAAIAYDERLDVRDAADGTVRWTRDLTGAPSVAVDDDAVYLADGGRVLGLDPVTGEGRWEVDLDAGSIGVGDGLLVARTADLRLVGLDAATGAERWRTDPDPALAWGAIRGMTDRVVVVQASGGNVAAHDIVTGARRWAFNEDDQLGLDLTAAADRVVITTDEPSLLVLDDASGEVLREDRDLDVLVRADVDRRHLAYTASLRPGSPERHAYLEPTP